MQPKQIFLVCVLLIALLFAQQKAHSSPLQPPTLENLKQAHHLEEPTSASSITLFVISGILGAANLTLLVGHAVSLANKKNIRMWGVLGITTSIVTMLGLTPLYAEEDGAWFLLPLIPGAALLTLSIINLATQPKKKSKPITTKSSPPPKSLLLLRY